VACSRLSGHIQPSKSVYFTLQRSWIKLVRPLSTVCNTRDYARVSHSRQWSNYNLTHVQIPRPCDATELNNDDMIKLGDVHYKQNRILIFFRKRFNQRRLQLMFANSVNNWRAVSWFSVWKAVIKCLSFTVNGIFDDVRYDVISSYCLHVMMLQCWSKFSNVLVHSSIRMIRAKNYETVSKFVKVMPRILWPLFFPDTV